MYSVRILYILLFGTNYNFHRFPGRELPGHRAVRRVPGGRPSLHPLPGHRPAGAPAAPAVLLRVRHALHGRRDTAIQPGTAQVRLAEFLVSLKCDDVPSNLLQTWQTCSGICANVWSCCRELTVQTEISLSEGGKCFCCDVEKVSGNLSNRSMSLEA